MPEEKFLSQTYKLESNEETFAHYEAWAETYDEEITASMDVIFPQRCSKKLKRQMFIKNCFWRI